jgi:hypothetical protein
VLLPRQVVAGIGVGVGGVWRVAGGGQTMVDLVLWVCSAPRNENSGGIVLGGKKDTYGTMLLG